MRLKLRYHPLVLPDALSITNRWLLEINPCFHRTIEDSVAEMKKLYYYEKPDDTLLPHFRFTQLRVVLS